MSELYDFQNLSYDDFERLSSDCLQVALGVRFESFRVGRDRGIDLRYAPSEDNVSIVQCKRYAPEAVARLVRDLTVKELPKVRRLTPQRYILSTSCRLSPDNKEQLMSALSPYCRATGDIFGADELNSIISNNRDIERRHFKLWMGSTIVLQQVLNAGIYNYSQHEVDRLRQEVSRYVVHDGFYRALEVLDREHHCIIVGIPGVGKTTAARLLLAHYLMEGFEIVSVTGDIGEAWRVIEHTHGDEKLVVYYDDFLGQMGFAQKLGKNEDRRILDLMEHCKRSRGKRFILTTRDYLFDQALSAYEPLGRAGERLRRSSVSLDDYDQIVRAKLLANHLQFSELPFPTLDKLVSTKAYRKIISHQNFLPRVIDEICRSSEAIALGADEFISGALAKLEDHAAVWSRPFSHLSFDARLLAYALASLDGQSEIRELESAWRALKGKFSINVGVDRLFIEVLKETEGSFTSSQACSVEYQNSAPLSGYIVRFLNPSTREFVLSDLLSRPDIFAAILGSSIAYRQLFFWREARGASSGVAPSIIACENLDLIVDRSSALLNGAEPEFSNWQRGAKVVWRRGARIRRIYLLVGVLSQFSSQGLLSKMAVNILALSSDGPLNSLVYDDVFWLPEVVKALVEALPDGAPPSEEVKRIAESTVNWADVAIEIKDHRYVWEAAEYLMEFAEVDSEIWETAREFFIDHAWELVSDIPAEMSANDVAEVASDLNEFATYVDEDELLVRATALEDTALELSYKEREYEGDEGHGGGYANNMVRTEIQDDIDGIFEELVFQTSR